MPLSAPEARTRINERVTVEMVVKAARRGYRIVEVPVTCRARLGRSKVAGTLKGSALAGYHLLFTTLRYAWRR